MPRMRRWKHASLPRHLSLAEIERVVASVLDNKLTGQRDHAILLLLARADPALFRHSAATGMLRGGASFKEIADVLGHKSLDTTTIYAKLDLPALARVSLPWPGSAL